MNISLSSLLCDLLKCEWEGRDEKLRHLFDITGMTTREDEGRGENTSPCPMFLFTLFWSRAHGRAANDNQSGVFLKIAAHQDHGLN